MTSRLLVCSLVAVAAAGVSTAALADGVPPDLMITFDAAGDGNAPIDYHWDWAGDQPIFGEHSVPQDESIWTGWLYSGSDAMDGAWTFEWDVIFNEPTAVAGGGGSAFVTANITVTNNSLTFENFTTSMLLPLSQPILSPEMAGSIIGTVTDLTFDSATVAAPAGWQIYTPRIDGIDEAGGFLMSDPFSETAGFLGQQLVGPQDFGVPSPVSASRDALSSIGLFLSFDLSPGDAVQFTAIFELMPVPAPAGLPLLAAGLLARRRRRL